MFRRKGDPVLYLSNPAGVTPEEQRATGVTDDYVRLSIGIEHIDDILADLDQALGAAQSFRSPLIAAE